MLPVCILCGGHGTRSGLPINKCFADINGKPFILYQLEWLETQGHTTIVLCRGTEGTLTAVRKAVPQLGKRFLVLYGDTLLRLDLGEFCHEWFVSGLPAATAVYDGVDAGVSGVQAWALDLVGDDVTDFAVWRDHMDACDHRYCYEAPARWVEVGSPEGLVEARRVLGT